MIGGMFMDTRGKPYSPGRYRFTAEVTLTPSTWHCARLRWTHVTIGIGFHWERKERQVFRGAFRLVKPQAGLTVINDVPLEEYVTSVISSEMSASCPPELLKLTRDFAQLAAVSESKFRSLRERTKRRSRFSRNPSLVRPRSASGFRCVLR